MARVIAFPVVVSCRPADQPLFEAVSHTTTLVTPSRAFDTSTTLPRNYSAGQIF
jgi:hypothetical protein